ncbi:hypothetical protein J2X61_001321 [Bacillus sp. 3255]|nr:hypothetical protein [Bacillus sp. 3255]
MESTRFQEVFQQLTRHTQWKQTGRLRLPFQIYHPQGMVYSGGLFYLSSVELSEAPVPTGEAGHGYDRTAGKGTGHLYVMDEQGQLLHDIQLGEGAMYHPGGIDTDGRHIWIPVAEYRPHSQSIIYKLDMETLVVEEAFRFPNHIGGLICNRHNGTLIGQSWGSRRFFTWTPTGDLLQEAPNSSHFIDYQDGQYVGGGCMLLSGIAELPASISRSVTKYELGGLAFVDMQTFQLIHEVPVAEFSPQGHVITRNPVYVKLTDQVLRLYAVPDDDFGDLLVYEVRIS